MMNTIENGCDLPKVVLSNAFRQHSHQLAYSLQEADMLKCFYTSIWFKPNNFPYSIIKYFPPKLKRKISFQLHKRYFQPLNSNLINQVPYPEIKYRFFMFWTSGKSYYINRAYDKLVSRKLCNIQFDVFIGYELCSLESFKYCKSINKICIYDLASMAYNYQFKAFQRYKDVYITKILNDEIAIKKQEINLADYFIVPSELVKNSLMELGIEDNRIIKIPFGIDLGVFKAKEKYNSQSNLKILFVGHIELFKGIEYLLESIKQINNATIELILVGKIGSAFRILSKYKGWFTHREFMHKNELAELYRTCDLFISPSLIEGFSQVVIEAMASGIPVIVTDRTGSHEAVHDALDIR